MQGWVVLLLLLCAGVVTCSSKVSSRLAHAISQQDRASTRDVANDVHLWVYFTNKDQRTRSEEVIQHIHPQALKRRSKVMNTNELVNEHDFPVNPHYISQVEGVGVTVRRTSKWLNAVSIYNCLFQNLHHVILY